MSTMFKNPTYVALCCIPKSCVLFAPSAGHTAIAEDKRTLPAHPKHSPKWRVQCYNDSSYIMQMASNELHWQWLIVLDVDILQPTKSRSCCAQLSMAFEKVKMFCSTHFSNICILHNYIVHTSWESKDFPIKSQPWDWKKALLRPGVIKGLSMVHQTVHGECLDSRNPVKNQFNIWLMFIVDVGYRLKTYMDAMRWYMTCMFIFVLQLTMASQHHLLARCTCTSWCFPTSGSFGECEISLSSH